MHAAVGIRNVNILPVTIPSISLSKLRVEIDKVACEKEVILRSYSHGIAHEGCGVDSKGAGHAAGYTVLSSDHDFSRIWRGEAERRQKRASDVTVSIRKELEIERILTFTEL
jgi:hypothetical protein